MSTDQKQCDGSGKVPSGPRHSSGHPNGPWVDCPGCPACLPKTDNLPAECGGSGSFDAMSGDLRVRVDCPGCPACTCACGHTRHWHGQESGAEPGSGACDDCSCQRFRPDQPSVEVSEEAVEAVRDIPSAFVGASTIGGTAAREVVEAAAPAIAAKAEEQARQQVREELLSGKTVTAVRALYVQRGINKPVGAVRLDLETALDTALATLDHKGETDG